MTWSGAAPDVVIVGGGTAGCVLAARLSEDPDRRVLLLEAGAAPRTLDAFPASVRDGSRLLAAAPGSPENGNLTARIVPGRDWGLARGRILGGSSATNGGYLVRPRIADADRWEAAGGERWSWARLLPLLIGLERDLDLGDRPGHGGSGPMPIRRASLAHPVSKAAMTAAADLGIPHEPDKNDQGPPGAGPVPLAILDGLRVNAAMAYLLPVLGRPNLEVRGVIAAHRVEVRSGRATAVHAGDATSGERIAAGEIVLAAGALSTPQILLRSGIGPASDLSRLGLDVVRDAPGVGAAISDHPQLRLDWRPARALPTTGHWMGAQVNLPLGDIELLPTTRSVASLIGGADDGVVSVLAGAHAPRRRGGLRLRSADPGVPPEIDLGYLRNEWDRGLLRAAARAAATLLDEPPLRALVGEALDPPPDRARDGRALDEWIARRLATAFHSCGTAPFGPEDDRDAVVDGEGRVRGIDGLRVGDLSILPTAPTRGPALSALLVGEVIADAMRA